VDLYSSESYRLRPYFQASVVSLHTNYIAIFEERPVEVTNVLGRRTVVQGGIKPPG